MPDYLTCLLGNLHANQEATVRTGHETMVPNWERNYVMAVYCCLFNLYAEYITQNAGLDEAQAGIKIDGRNVNNLRYASLVTQLAMNPPAMQETLVQFQEDPQRRDRLPTPVFLGFPGGTDGKNWPAMWET